MRNTILLLLIILVIIASGFYTLRHGISIRDLKVGNFRIEGLYLKLDNRFTLKAHTLVIPKNSKKKVDIEETIYKIKKVMKYFDLIELDNVKYTNDTYRIIISNDVIYIDNKKYEIAGVLNPKDNFLDINVSVFRIKKYDLDIKGNATYGYHTNTMTFKGSYKMHSYMGNFFAQKENDLVSFVINSNSVSNIDEIVNMIPMSKGLNNRLKNKIKAKSYKIVSLQGNFILKKDGINIDYSKIKADFLLSNAKVYFNAKLAPLHAKTIKLRLHDRTMKISALKVGYKKKRLSISKIIIANLFAKESAKLLLDFELRSRLDNVIKKILKSYGINLPLYQKTGSTDTSIKLKIDLGNGNTKINGLSTISKGVMDFLGTPLHTNGGKVSFDDKQVSLHNIKIDSKVYNILINGVVIPSKKKAKLKINIKRLMIGSKKGMYLYAKNLIKVPALIDFSKNIFIDIPIYGLKIESEKHNSMKIISKNLNKILPYIKGLPIKATGGNITINTTNAKEYSFVGNTLWKDSYIYKKEYIHKIDFSGTFDESGVLFKALKDRIEYNSKKNMLSINNMNIDIKKILNQNSSSKDIKDLRLKIVGKNNILRYDKHALLSDNLTAIFKGKKITFLASKDGDKLEIDKSGSHINIYADMIRDKMLKALTHFGGFSGGRYSMLLSGDVNGTMKGVIDIKGGIVNSFKAYNNTIALLNTLPAIMTLSNPGFSNKGFEINNGHIKFRLLSDKIIFDDILINGKSSTIAGKGRVETKSGKLNMDIAIRTARGIGKVLGSLPIVGYIFFGKDKSITTGVKIIGTLDKPIVKTHPVLETLLYPLSVLKRTIESPAHIINK